MNHVCDAGEAVLDSRESGKLVVSPEAGVAQLVEQLIRNQQVIGSSPIAGSKILVQISMFRKTL